MDTPTPTAQFYVKNADAWNREWDVARQALPSASVQEFDRATILPLRWRKGGPKRNFEGGVVSESGEFLAGLRRAFDDSDPPFTTRTSYSVEAGIVENRDEEVVFGGVLFDHIGHLVTDSTARLWYLFSAADTRKIVFLRSPEFKNWSPVDWKPLLELSGIDLSRVEVLEKPTRFRKVVVPQEAYYAHGGFRPEWRRFFDAIRSRVCAGACKKVYLSRSKFARGNVFNEDLFEEYYRKLGYFVAYPEELDFRQKAELISGADELVATIGTTSHLFLFAKPGVKATVLLRTGSVLKMQLYIGAAGGERCSYVEVCSNVLPTFHVAGVYCLAPTSWFRSFLASSGLPPFGDSGNDVANEDGRVRPYVERWFRDYSVRLDVFADSASSDQQKRGRLAWLFGKMEDSASRDAMVDAVSSFVRSELERRSKLSAARVKLDESRSRLAETRGELAETRGELAETRGELAETRGKLAETREKLADARRELRETKDELNRMWRRTFRGRVHSLLCFLRIVRPASKRAPGTDPAPAETGAGG